MKTYNTMPLKTGYVTYPDDWIVINPDCAALSCYVIVIEVNTIALQVPHILYLSSCPAADLSDEDEERIIDQCELICPAYSYLRDMQVHLIFDDHCNAVNNELVSQAPNIWLYDIPVLGTTHTYPGGAMVVR